MLVCVVLGPTFSTPLHGQECHPFSFCGNAFLGFQGKKERYIEVCGNDSIGLLHPIYSMEYLSLYIMSKTFFIFSPLFPLFFTIHRRKGAHLGWTAGQFGATWDSFNKTDEELRFSLYFCASTHGTLCVSSSNLLLSEWDRFSSSSLS